MTEQTTKTRKPRRMAREPQTASKAAASGSDRSSHTPAQPTAPSTRNNKTSLVLDLLRRSEGATLDQLVDATGWLPHSTRAMLTALRKKGHALSSEKAGDSPRTYRIADGAEAEASAA